MDMSDISLQSLCEQFNLILQDQLTTSGSNHHDVSGLLSAAKSDIFSCLIKQMIKDEFEKNISSEIDGTGNIAQQTWRIVAYNITKKISESTEMVNFIKNMETTILARPNSTGIKSFESAEKVNNNIPCVSNPRQMQHLLNDTCNDKPVSTRIQAFNILLRSQISQMLFISRESRPKTWSLMRQILHKSLYEENHDIFNLSLKIHTKFVTSSHPQVITEGFISLVQGLSLYYSTDDMNYSTTVKGLTVDNPTHQRALKISHLLLFTIKQVSRNSFRSNERLLEEIWESFFKLLVTKIDDTTCITPFSIVSVLDPLASWFTHIMHGAYARETIFSLLPTISLVRNITKQVVTPVTIGDMARYASFIHSNKVFMIVVKYHRGRSFFPLATKIEDEPITLQQIYVYAVNYLNKNNTIGLTVVEEMLKDGIPIVIKAGILKSDGPLMRAILEPLPSSIPYHTANLLETVVASPEGVQCLMGAHDTKTLFDFTTMVLKEQLECCLAIKISILGTCGKILASHRGCTQYIDSPLVPKVVGYFQQQLSLKTDPGDPLIEALLRFLTSVAVTPLGSFCLSHHVDLLTYLQQVWSVDNSTDARKCLSVANYYLGNGNQFRLHLAPNNHTNISQRERTSHGNSELYKFLRSSKGSPHDNNWHNQLRRAFKASGQQPTKTHVILELVDQLARDAAHITPRLRRELTTPPSPEIIEAATWIVSYGESHHLLQAGPMRHVDNIVQLFGSYHQGHSEFDWFLAIAYLICGGHIDKCYTFVAKISSLPAVHFIWPDRDCHQFIKHTFEFGHQLETIVHDELPYAVKGLQMGGMSWWLACRHWIDQCFINALSWDQVCHWLIYSLTGQPEHQVYYCVALLKHLQPTVLSDISNDGDVNNWLDKHINGFRITDHFSFIDKLAKRCGIFKN